VQSQIAHSPRSQLLRNFSRDTIGKLLAWILATAHLWDSAQNSTREVIFQHSRYCPFHWWAFHSGRPSGNNKLDSSPHDTISTLCRSIFQQGRIDPHFWSQFFRQQQQPVRICAGLLRAAELLAAGSVRLRRVRGGFLARSPTPKMISKWLTFGQKRNRTYYYFFADWIDQTLLDCHYRRMWESLWEKRGQGISCIDPPHLPIFYLLACSFTRFQWISPHRFCFRSAELAALLSVSTSRIVTCFRFDIWLAASTSNLAIFFIIWFWGGCHKVQLQLLPAYCLSALGIWSWYWFWISLYLRSG